MHQDAPVCHWSQLQMAHGTISQLDSFGIGYHHHRHHTRRLSNYLIGFQRISATLFMGDAIKMFGC